MILPSPHYFRNLNGSEPPKVTAVIMIARFDMRSQFLFMHLFLHTGLLRSSLTPLHLSISVFFLRQIAWGNDNLLKTP